MLPLVIAGAVWAYNIVKIAQIANRNNQLSKRDSDDVERNLAVFHNCNIHYEDKRTYNFYSNCTFNTYNFRGGKDDER